MSQSHSSVSASHSASLIPSSVSSPSTLIKNFSEEESVDEIDDEDDELVIAADSDSDTDVEADSYTTNESGNSRKHSRAKSLQLSPETLQKKVDYLSSQLVFVNKRYAEMEERMGRQVFELQNELRMVVNIVSALCQPKPTEISSERSRSPLQSNSEEKQTKISETNEKSTQASPSQHTTNQQETQKKSEISNPNLVVSEDKPSDPQISKESTQPIKELPSKHEENHDETLNKEEIKDNQEIVTSKLLVSLSNSGKPKQNGNTSNGSQVVILNTEPSKSSSENSMRFGTNFSPLPSLYQRGGESVHPCHLQNIMELRNHYLRMSSEIPHFPIRSDFHPFSISRPFPSNRPWEHEMHSGTFHPVSFENTRIPTDQIYPKTGKRKREEFDNFVKSSGKPKKRRGNLPEKATSFLKTWLFAHEDRPYPTEEEKTELVNSTGLTLVQINNWFSNARRRILKRGKDGESDEGPDSETNSSTGSTTNSATN